MKRSNRGMVLITDGTTKTLVVASALDVWRQRGWGLAEDVPDEPEAPQETPRETVRARAKPRRRAKPAHAPRDDSAATLESDGPATGTTEE